MEAMTQIEVGGSSRTLFQIERNPAWEKVVVGCLEFLVGTWKARPFAGVRSGVGWTQQADTAAHFRLHLSKTCNLKWDPRGFVGPVHEKGNIKSVSVRGFVALALSHWV